MNNSRKFQYFSSFLFLAIGLGIMFWIFPYAFDDYSYMNFLQIHENGLPVNIDWSKFHDNFIYRKQSDNLRLANMTAVFGLAFPKWIIGLLSGVFFALSVWISGKILGWRNENAVSSVLLACLLLFFLPWWNGIAAVDYQFNYIWATLVFVFVIWLFLRTKRVSWIAGLIFGGLLGIWHEGFSFPALIGLSLIYISFKRYRDIGRLIMLMSMFLGICFLLWVPGMRERTGFQSYLLSSYYFLRTLLALMPVWIFFILSTIYWIKEKKNLLKSPIWLVMVSVCVVSGAMKFVQDDFRAAWTAIFMGCMGTAWMCNLLFNSYNRLAKIIVGYVVLIFIVCHLVVVDMEAFRERKVLQQVVEDLRNDKGTQKNIFIKDLKGFYNAPLLAWGKPLQTMWRWPGFDRYYDIRKERMQNLSIVPDELRNFNPEKASLMNCGWWKTEEGWVVKPHVAPLPPRHMIIEAPLADEIVWVTFNSFRSEYDGRLYDHVFPTLAPPWVRPIIDIREVE